MAKNIAWTVLVTVEIGCHGLESRQQGALGVLNELETMKHAKGKDTYATKVADSNLDGHSGTALVGPCAPNPLLAEGLTEWAMLSQSDFHTGKIVREPSDEAGKGWVDTTASSSRVSKCYLGFQISKSDSRDEEDTCVHDPRVCGRDAPVEDDQPSALCPTQQTRRA